MERMIQLTNGATAKLIAPNTVEKEKYILYLHGGGLVYGSKADFPQILEKLFLKHGFAVITLDYLLSPNSPLTEIVEELAASFTELRKKVIKEAEFLFCGRSAGGYLMQLLTDRLLQGPQPPTGLINFYGYYDLAFAENVRKLAPQTITAEELKGIDKKDLVWDDPLLSRYLLYLYAVQNRSLLRYYGVTAENRDRFELTAEELKKFPPVFSSASSTDEEVPFKYSKTLAKLNTAGTFKPVYYLPHDFLKEESDPSVLQVIEALGDWLEDFD